MSLQLAITKFKTAIKKLSTVILKAGFDPEQPRGEDGKWTASGWALRGYVHPDYPSHWDINSHLRTGRPLHELHLQNIQDLDGTIDTFGKLPTQKTLYRNLDPMLLATKAGIWGGKDLKMGEHDPFYRDVVFNKLGLKVGDVIVDPAFLSLSSQKAGARKFGSLQLEIDFPAGAKVLSLAKLPERIKQDLSDVQIKSEHEFIAHRDTPLRIDGMDAKRKTIKMTYLTPSEFEKVPGNKVRYFSGDISTNIGEVKARAAADRKRFEERGFDTSQYHPVTFEQIKPWNLEGYYYRGQMRKALVGLQTVLLRCGC